MKIGKAIGERKHKMEYMLTYVEEQRQNLQCLIQKV